MSEIRLIDANALSDSIKNGVGTPLQKFFADACVAATPTYQINGETSDGYHTFNELYHHRAVLFSVICNTYKDISWKSKRHDDGTMYDGMFIVGIETPNGQATYHYDIEPYWDMFDVKELEYAPKWDGHTPEKAIERIGKLSIRNNKSSYTLKSKMAEWYPEYVSKENMGGVAGCPNDYFRCGADCDNLSCTECWNRPWKEKYGEPKLYNPMEVI